jgi:hypothetical protein
MANLGDNLGRHLYLHAMAERKPHIEMTLQTSQPIEVADFVSAFTALSNQYAKYMTSEYPTLAEESTVYVREVRSGSIVADLVPWALARLPSVIAAMDQLLIVERFVSIYGRRLNVFFSDNASGSHDSRSDLKDFMGQVAAIANDPNGKSAIEAVYFEGDEKRVKAALKFNTSQARTATRAIEERRTALENKSDADYQRVLMVFYQSNIKDTTLGVRTGERVLIEDISPDDRPLIYASKLAEEQIKHEIREAEDNVYKKGFIVDVNVELRRGKPIGYRVTNLHQVIDLPDK